MFMEKKLSHKRSKNNFKKEKKCSPTVVRGAL